jgi:hypothetical protein
MRTFQDTLKELGITESAANLRQPRLDLLERLRDDLGMTRKQAEFVLACLSFLDEDNRDLSRVDNIKQMIRLGNMPDSAQRGSAS